MAAAVSLGSSAVLVCDQYAGFGAHCLLQTPSVPQSAAVALQRQLLYLRHGGDLIEILGSKWFGRPFVDTCLGLAHNLCLNSLLGSQVLFWNIAIRLKHIMEVAIFSSLARLLWWCTNLRHLVQNEMKWIFCIFMINNQEPSYSSCLLKNTSDPNTATWVAAVGVCYVKCSKAEQVHCWGC